MGKKTSKVVVAVGAKYMNFKDQEFKEEIENLGEEYFFDNVRSLAASTVSQYEKIKKIEQEHKQLEADMKKKAGAKETKKDAKKGTTTAKPVKDKPVGFK